MLTSPRIFRALALAASAVIAATGPVAGAPASASPTTTAVTILLKAPNQAGLDRLATAHGLTHAQRVAALASLLPSPKAHRAVTDNLRRGGFTITHETAWTVDAQAPTATVTATFGSGTAALGNDASQLARIRAGSALPRTPAAIAPFTAAVLAKSTGPQLFHPRDLCSAQCHDGGDFRNAYSSTKSVLHRGADTNGPLTIATLQFPLRGGWNESDLTKYAAKVGLPDPVASGQYQQFAVDGSSVPAATTNEGGADEEVDLDQETILSTSPLSNQRAYFDTNANKAGYADALSQVLADVTQGAGAIGGGDPKIAALSTSWGTCEAEFSDRFAFPHDTVKAVGNILKSLTAAGVTVFAASGDNGVYDCGDSAQSTRTAVDYPASSPQVVAVGGTRLKFIGNSSANNGTNWADTAWTCVSAETCQGVKRHDTGGSGGGESKLFGQPDYQAAGIGHAPFTTTTGQKGDFGAQRHRLVPDIAADGDPASGFETLTTDPKDVKSCALGANLPTCKPKSFAIGGTSLSAPASAALFTDMLAAHNATAGVGDIHDALYSAYAAHRGAFRDIKSGRNGHQKDVDSAKGPDFPVTAEKGFDTVTGLGAPLWPALSPYLFAPTPPIPVAKLALPHGAKHPNRLVASWSSQQASRGGLLARSADVTITSSASMTPVYTAHSAPATGSHGFIGQSGVTYTMSVSESDLAGATSSPVTDTVVVPYDDNHFTYHGAWQSVPGNSDFGGSREVSVHRGAFARFTGAGTVYSLGVRTGPTYGKIAIFHGGTKLGVFDLYTPSVSHRFIPFFGTSTTPRKSRSFTFYVTGRKNSSASSFAINIDSVIR